MAIIPNKSLVELAFRRTLSDDEYLQVLDLARRAERELGLLVGDLSAFDDELVRDTLLDAIREEWVNPERFRSETDDSYSYTRFSVPGGIRGRFWWPLNLYGLFGIERAVGRPRTVIIGSPPAMRGWL